MGSSTQKTTSSTQPSNPQVTQTVNQLLGGVRDAYSAGPQVFNQSLYTGQGGNTQAGLAGLLSSAQNPNYFGAANDYAGDLIGSGGLTGGQQGSIGAVGNIGGQYMGFAGGGGPSLTESTMMDTAMGNRFGMDDPGYAAVRQRLSDDVSREVGQTFTNSGRFGSGSHVDSLTSALTSNLGALDYSNFQNDQNRQMQALGAIEGTRQQDVGNRFAGLAGALGAQGQGFSMGQQGVANAMGASASLPSLWQAMQAPAQTQLAVGTAQDADAQAQRQGEYDLFQRNANADTDLLAKLSGILAGNAAATGTTTTQTSPSTPWWQLLLGGGIAGLSKL